jgi:hypothetical protein
MGNERCCIIFGNWLKLRGTDGSLGAGPEPVITRPCWRGLRATTGTVVAYEIEHDLAQNAIRNLSDLSKCHRARTLGFRSVVATGK